MKPFEFDSGLKTGVRTGVTCLVTEGLTPLTFHWFKDGVALKETDVTKIYTNEDMSSLSFKSLRANDSGEYKCSVSNNEGVDSFGAVLTVRGKYLIPQEKQFQIFQQHFSSFSRTDIHRKTERY